MLYLDPEPPPIANSDHKGQLLPSFFFSFLLSFILSLSFSFLSPFLSCVCVRCVFVCIFT